MSARNFPEWQEQYFAGMHALGEGRFVEADLALQGAYDRARKPPADEMWVARTLYGLGSLARTRGDCRTAERLQSEAGTMLEGLGAGVGVERRHDRAILLAMVWNELGESLLEQGRLDEAVKLVTKAQGVFEQDATARQWGLLCRRHLAEVQIMRSDLAGAEESLKKLIADERLEPASTELTSALGLLGRLYIIERRFSEAESMLQEAGSRALAHGEKSLSFADTRVAMATLYRVQGRLERAEPLLRKSLKIYEATGDPRAAEAYAELGRCAMTERKFMTAHNLFAKAVDAAAKASMPDIVLSRLRDDLAAAGPTYANAERSRH